MSIRLRLTLLYTAILALTLVTFSAALYATVSGVAERALAAARDDLASDAQRLVESRDFRLDEVGGLPIGKGQLIPPGTSVQTLGLDGAVLDRTANLEGVELPALEGADLRAVRDKGFAYTTAPEGPNQLLIYSKRVDRDSRGNAGIVQVVRRIDDQARSLGTLRRTLVAGTLLVPLLACGAGWLLARFALRPIARITATARAIGASRDFGRRVDHAGPQDEVGRLATTVNGMLAALQAAHEQTAGALQTQRRFVADASHELRTPLTTMRGNLALLQRDPPIGEEDRRAALADLVAETERMGRLVNVLLTLARVDAGRPLAREPVELAPLLDDVCRRARLLAPRRTIGCEVPAGLAVLGDRDALQQVLLILLDNALKYTPADGTVGVAATLADRGVTIAVRDSGIGIPASALPHLFERFYRVDAARSRGGAGLGLAIAKALVDGQGGTIAVESREGAGSVFTVTLPEAPAVAASPRAARRPEAALASSTGPTRGAPAGDS